MQAAKKAKPLFKSSDFESSECSVVMRNVTTSTDLPKSQKARMTEIGKGTLTLHLPKGACSVGHCLLLRFFDKDVYARVQNSPRSVQDKAQRMSVTVRVKEVVPAGVNSCLAVLELQQYVEKEWAGFIGSFAAIQANVSGLVKRIKE
jgi:hypothetical protein